MSLDHFIALLALDPDRRERFLADPSAELEAAGLGSPKAKALTSSLERICRALSEYDFPPPNEPVGGPGGGGSVR